MVVRVRVPRPQEAEQLDQADQSSSGGRRQGWVWQGASCSLALT